MKKLPKYFVLILGLSWISLYVSCHTLSTTAGSPASGPVNGMLYYLPIGKVTIKGEFKPAPSPNPGGSRSNNNNLADASPPPGSPAGSPANPSDADAEKPQAAPGSTVISAGELTITLTSEVEADSAAGEYYVTPRANYIYEDEARIGVNPKQLLSTGNVTTEDKTADIVGALASIAAEVPRGGLLARVEPKNKKRRLPFYFTLHPSNRGEVKDVKDELAERDIEFDVESAVVHQAKQVHVGNAQARELGERGLIFRPATSYKIILSFSGKDPNDPDKKELPLIKSAQQFVMPDPTRLYEMEYPRMAFVKKVKEIGFRDGMLTEFHQKTPSPILGFLGIPKAVLQAIVPIPGAGSPNSSASTSGTTTAAPPKS